MKGGLGVEFRIERHIEPSLDEGLAEQFAFAWAVFKQ